MAFNRGIHRSVLLMIFLLLGGGMGKRWNIHRTRMDKVDSLASGLIDTDLAKQVPVVLRLALG